MMAVSLFYVKDRIREDFPFLWILGVEVDSLFSRALFEKERYDENDYRWVMYYWDKNSVPLLEGCGHDIGEFFSTFG